MVFTNDRTLGRELAKGLEGFGWPAAFLSGDCGQHHRSDVMNRFRSFKLRLLISTDLTARGIDVENVNFVINLDMPWDSETYLHRIGRTGRYGSVGVAITFLTRESLPGFIRMLENLACEAAELPATIDKSLYLTADVTPDALLERCPVVAPPKPKPKPKPEHKSKKQSSEKRRQDVGQRPDEDAEEWLEAMPGDDHGEQNQNANAQPSESHDHTGEHTPEQLQQANTNEYDAASYYNYYSWYYYNYYAQYYDSNTPEAGVGAEASAEWSQTTAHVTQPTAWFHRLCNCQYCSVVRFGSRR
eukprot:c19189_g1_i2.p1 GENE.c19189_g1_i2~~c19189_g1_i2.p1  ORF type:complete len:301 (+),score=51.12 c19189_g1_i2:280-1182(+)